MTRIEEALDIIKALGLPETQHNERTALTLLALLDLKDNMPWSAATNKLIGITPIMTFIGINYNRAYKPNTRETIRKESIKQLVAAGFAVMNPDKPDRAVNSPGTVYQVEPSALMLMQEYGTSTWKQSLETFLEAIQTLKEKYAKEREMQLVPVKIGNVELDLSSGAHSLLIKGIIEDFAPRFVPDSILIYTGDTGGKWQHFDKELATELNIRFDPHGKMPDVILYYPAKNWLILAEAVTSTGPVNGERYDELVHLFKDSTAPLVFVTAFPSRKAMRAFLPNIAWETEVWCADAPSHLIHFNGDKFLGPH
jgi:hypothetical protein